MLDAMTRREWLAAAAAPPLAAAPAADVERFFDDFFARWLRLDPQRATSLRYFPGGEQDRLDGRLTDIGDDAAMARISLAREGLSALRRFPRASLTPDQQLSAEIMEFQLRDVVAEQPHLLYDFPLEQFRGVQVGLPTFLTDLHPVRTPANAENYLLRLRGLGPKVNFATRMMQERAARRIRLPAFIAVETINQMKRFIAPDPARNILVTSFTERLGAVGGLPEAKKTAMSVSAVQIVRDSVYPAYRRAIDALAAENANATDDAGLWRLPRGAAAYAFYLRRYTTTSLTPDEVHRIGLDEVARIEAEMDALFRKIGYGGRSIEERWTRLENANLFVDGPDVRDRVLAEYTRIIRENNQLSAAAFDRRPRAACVVQRIPEFQEANAAANYSAPPPDGSRPGIFRVPLRGPTFSRAGMKTLAAHEAIPGHHFQSALQVEMTNLPAFRRFGGYGNTSAFGEGWALYAERLASELGWYGNDAVSDLGRLNAELFRARRLVVDTGIHAKRWTREQAIAYGIRQSEVDRYVVMPGQACSYKIGQMKFLELREEARAKMGARFTLKGYHNVALGYGRLPLTLLELVVREWGRG
jgi:uncharacterized protein (DUF885 family)